MKSVSSSAKAYRTSPAQSTQFEVIFQTHWPRVYAVLLRMVGDPAEAEDLALEVFLRLHERPQIQTPENNISAWLYRVATNLGYNALRAARRRQIYEQQALEERTDHPADPEQEADLSIARSQVRSVLAQMKPRAARILILRHSGLTYAEIADSLEISAGSVGTLLSRAEKAFEKHYLKLYGKDEA